MSGFLGCEGVRDVKQTKLDQNASVTHCIILCLPISHGHTKRVKA